MSDDPSQSTSAAPPRPKVSRGSISAGTVRPRASPPPVSSNEQNGDGRPPTKRARKAINCEPCRNSKLKCDRNRPCSSCVLRGTSASCYQDGRGHDADPFNRDELNHSRIDPAQEIARLRHSIGLLEAHIFPHQRNHASIQSRRTDSLSVVLKKEIVDPNVADRSHVPGMLASPGEGGLYAGPTSAATHLLINGGNSEEAQSRQQSEDRGLGDLSGMPPEYDRDLLAALPPLEIIDELIEYYFEYCNWIYRHVYELAFRRNWERFKNGSSSDRLVLATVSVIMAVAVHYLPCNHHLLESFPEGHEEIGQKFYAVAKTAQQRRQADNKTYTIELVELILIRAHFQTLSKTDTEEIWCLKGDLVTIGTAMGLHRDPGKFKLHRDVAERRRWAWWHIVLLERWQAFMFGRPVTICSRHFDTQMPSYCDPAIDKTGRYFLPNITLFRLSYILGEIMDDAVSVRPVPYESVLANDRLLTQWNESLPPELDLDEYRIARNLASPIASVRRLGVQSVIIRTSYYHMRFTLHRPYASAVASPSSSLKATDPSNAAHSLEIAVSAADKLISMVGQSRPDFLANSSLAVPGHMNWGPFHCFSAAMFFSFQLIANPDQPGAGLFRASIRKAVHTLEQSRGAPVAEKAFDILQALAPLYSADFPQMSKDVKEKRQSAVLSTVKKLAFPYHDSHQPRNSFDSPGSRATAHSPGYSSSDSPPMGVVNTLPNAHHQQQQQQQYESPQLHNPPTTSSVRTTPNQHYLPSPYSQSAVSPNQSTHQSMPQSPHIMHHQQPQMSPPTHPQMTSAHISPQLQYPQVPYQTPSQPQQPQQSHQSQHVYAESSRYTPYMPPIDDGSMWGASLGIGQGEWAQFLTDMQRPDLSPPGGHL